MVGGVVYIGALEGGFFALNGKTGVPLWDYGGYDFGVVSSAAVVDGRVYFGSLNGNVYARNSANGDIWNYTTTGGVASSPAVLDGVVYIGVGNPDIGALGSVYALTLQYGRDLESLTLTLMGFPRQLISLME